MQSDIGVLTAVGLLVASVLIGVASALDAHTEWLRLSRRARRFVAPEAAERYRSADADRRP